jgi:hypothetical protein
MGPRISVFHQENVPFVFGIFVSGKASFLTLALGNPSLSVFDFGGVSSVVNHYL